MPGMATTGGAVGNIILALGPPLLAQVEIDCGIR